MAPLEKNKSANIYPRTLNQRDAQSTGPLLVEAPRRSLRKKRSTLKTFAEISKQRENEIPARRYKRLRVDRKDNSVSSSSSPYLQKSIPGTPDTIPETYNSKIGSEQTGLLDQINSDQESEPARPAKRRRKTQQIRKKSSSPCLSSIQRANKRAKSSQPEDSLRLFLPRNKVKGPRWEFEIGDSYEAYRKINLSLATRIVVEIPAYKDFDRKAYYRLSATPTQSATVAKSSSTVNSPIQQGSSTHHGPEKVIPDSQELFGASTNEPPERDVDRSTCNQATPSTAKEGFELSKSDCFRTDHLSSQIQTNRLGLPQCPFYSTRPAFQFIEDQGQLNPSTIHTQESNLATDNHTAANSRFAPLDEDSESEDLPFLTQVPVVGVSSVGDRVEYQESLRTAAQNSIKPSKDLLGSTSTEAWQGAQIVPVVDFQLSRLKSAATEFEIHQDNLSIPGYASQQDSSQTQPTNSVLSQIESNSQASISKSQSSRSTSQEQHRRFKRASSSVVGSTRSRQLDAPQAEPHLSLRRPVSSPESLPGVREICGTVPDYCLLTPINNNMTDYEAVSSSSAMSIADQAKEARDKVRAKFALSSSAVIGFGPALSSPSGRVSYGMLPMRENVEAQPNDSLEDIVSPDGSVESSGNITLRLPDLKPREHIILLPLASMVCAVYRAAVINHKRDLTAFLSDEVIDPAVLERIDLLVEQLKMITDHQDLISSTPSDLSDALQAKWAVTCSTKCLFLQHFLEKLRQEDKHVAILARPGKMLDIIESILKVHDHVYERFDRPGQPNSRTKGHLRVSLLPTGLHGGQYVVSPADAVIAFDETFRASERYSGILRQHLFKNENLSPLISLVVGNSAEHLELCLSTQVDDIERKLYLVTFIAHTYQEVGKLEEEFASPEDTATDVAKYLHADNGTYGSWPLPTNPDITGLVGSAVRRILALSIPVSQSYEQQPQSAMKRSLRADSITVADLDSTKRMRMTPHLGDVGSSGDVSRVSDSVGNRSTTIPTSTDRASHDPFEKVNELDEKQSRQMSLLVEKVSDLQAEIQSNRACEERLQQLVKDLEHRLEDHILTIKKIVPKLRQALSDRGKYQGERDAAKSHTVILTQTINARIADISKLKEDKASLEQELNGAREILRNSTVPELAELARTQDRIRALKEEKDRLEKRTSNLQRDFDFTRDAYQKASSYTTELSGEIARLKQDNELLARKASDNAVRIAEIQKSNETQDREARIEELEAVLRDREQELRKKSEELKIKTNGRRETRGTSVPRSPRMGSGAMSPRPHFGKPGNGGSRGGSPAPGDASRDPSLFQPASALASSRWQHLT